MTSAPVVVGAACSPVGEQAVTSRRRPRAAPRRPR
ncbi:hypothetical protein J2S66_001004 [Saccharothrix longispora]|uniref:Uncharacterized protein n=1 Tax=Saccharothrix longispora TaxID=33920 RepID=A0ABU1PPQ6_9PSEU|nr:hypothetical protein [Saccharothrix longispora]